MAKIPSKNRIHIKYQGVVLFKKTNQGISLATHDIWMIQVSSEALKI